jgi:hypothetical protein
MLKNCRQIYRVYRDIWCPALRCTRLINLTIVVVEDHDDARRYLGLFLDPSLRAVPRCAF